MKFDHTNQWYMHNPASVMENERHKLLGEFWDTNGLPNLRQMTRPYNNYQKEKKKKRERSSRIVDFAVPVDHRVNLKESEKKDKYCDLAWELKKLWNMKVTFIPIVIGALDTAIKGLAQWMENLEIRRRVETIQITALLRSARILRRVLETWGGWLWVKLQWKTIS